jgi:predicted nucleic acid-binding protein
MLVLDTNVYIDVMESRERAVALAARLEDVEDEVAVSTVVVSELLIGLKEPKGQADTLRRLIAPSDTVVTPNHVDWLVAANALRIARHGARARLDSCRCSIFHDPPCRDQIVVMTK